MERLALCGGPAVLPEGPPVWPLADHAVRESVDKALADGSWGRYYGHNCERLAVSLAEFHGVPHVWLCCSGTFAVELALRALSVDSDAEVVLAGYDFSGNFRAIESVGATPVLVDIEPTGWRLTAEQVEASLSARTKAIVVSHLHGALADMAALRELADRRGLWLVEDACQAVGAVIDGRLAGAWGDVGVLSFGGSKLLSAGRGGAIITCRDDIFQRAKVYCERGNDAFPLSELQAAVLLPQVAQLKERNQLRRANVERLLTACDSVRAIRPVSGNSSHWQSAYYKLGFWLERDAVAGNSRETFISAIKAEGVAMDAGFRGFARRSPRRCRIANSLVHSQTASEDTIVLHHPVLLEQVDVIERVALAIRKVSDALAGSTLK